MPKIRFADYCCQGGSKEIQTESCTLPDLDISKRGPNTLRFSPLGNAPLAPRLALVGITPGSQSEVFAQLLRTQGVSAAAKAAAFAKGQKQIKELLLANDFSSRIGINLAGDLNDNPAILTTSLVKCCLLVDGSYKYKAPDIKASPEAAYCATNRFVSDIEKYPTLKWIVVFGDSGWEAVNSLRVGCSSLREHLESRGLVLLNFPHFAQNFQQRAIFRLRPEQTAAHLQEHPAHRPYAPSAERMRAALLVALQCHAQQT